MVQCQNERSQHKNRASALKQLRARLYEHEMDKRRAEERKLEDTKSDINFGRQIRSYVLAPYRMVKDLRTRSPSATWTAFWTATSKISSTPSSFGRRPARPPATARTTWPSRADRGPMHCSPARPPSSATAAWSRFPPKRSTAWAPTRWTRPPSAASFK